MEEVKINASLQCVVDTVRFKNEDTGFAVCGVSYQDKTGLPGHTSVVGILGDIVTGMEVTAHGEWVDDPKYGPQFRAAYCLPVIPSTEDGIEAFLASGAVKGIGKVYAGKIVHAFGSGTIQVLDSYPEMLYKVPGIGKKRAEAILQSWKEQAALRDLLIYLSAHDIPTRYAAAINAKFRAGSISMLENDPWQMTDIRGIGFLKADGIAMKLGFTKDDPKRIRAGIRYVLRDMCSSEGHIYAVPEELYSRSAATLGAPVDIVEKETKELIDYGRLVVDETRLYLPDMYEMEGRVARRVADMLRSRPSVEAKVTDPAVIGRALGVEFGEKQKEAIRLALTGGMVILTGGPGTGKTFTVNGILKGFKMNGLTVSLAAPTGRAAKRMQETTHMEAQTIHRLLGLKGFGDRDSDEPLECDALIVDECSMVDLKLMDILLGALGTGTRLVLVGDADQLPSVGPGRVFGDLIDSGSVPYVRLTEIRRQSAGSSIIRTAAAVHDGKMPAIHNMERGTDCFFDQKEEPEKVLDDIVQFASKKLPAYYHVSPDDVQVLSPMRRGIIGTENLNVRLQHAINPRGERVYIQGKEFRKGDRVMQIRNNYDKGVVNGDIGKIVSVDRDNQALTVKFDEASVDYESSDIDQLVLAYACTVHKSQGSEFPIVIVPVSTQHYVMLQRNLIYTAVTRAKSVLVLAGSWKALGIAVKNNAIKKRNTWLAQRVKSLCA